METDTEQVDSTALLEPSQEVEANVVSEEPSEEEGNGNMSLSELTEKLLAGQNDQSDDGEPASEQTEAGETPTEMEEPPTEDASEPQQAEKGIDDGALLKEQYGLDLDSMSEEQALALGRALRTDSMKRFGRLTAQKREAEAKIRELEEGTNQAEGKTADAAPKSNALEDIWTEETLTTKEKDLQSIEDWAEEALQREEQYDDDGEEYLVKEGDARYTKQDLLRIKANARKMLRRGGDVDDRRSFLAHRQQSDGEALGFFPWMSDEKTAEFGEYQELLAQERYKKMLDGLPEANIVAGLIVEGNLRVRERMKTKQGKNGSRTEKPIEPATASAAAPKRTSNSDSSRHKKALAAAKKNFEKTGSFQSLARLRELQAIEN